MKVGDKIRLLAPFIVKVNEESGYEIPAGTEGIIIEPPNQQQEFHHQEMILVIFDTGVGTYLFDPNNEIYEEVA